MPFELEALVGHLYVAGGRTIKTTPPGFLCEVAPKQAARGREIDTFFVLVLPSGTVAPKTFYEQMSLMAAERYFSNTGSVTAALRDVFNTLNHNLFEHNTTGHRHYEASMICAVLRAEDLYTARAGSAAMVLRSEGATMTLPEQLTDEEALFKPPLGVQPIPDVQLKRYPVHDGSRMVLSDASIAEITDENITQALSVGDIEQVLDDFKTLVSLQIQMMAVEFVPPDEALPVPAATGQSTAVLTTEIAAARVQSAPPRLALQPATGATESVQQSRSDTGIQRWAKQGVIGAARSAGHGLNAIGQLLNKLMGGEQEAENQRLSTRFIAAAVVGFPTIIILVVVLSWVGGVGATAFEECVNNAVQAANFARNLDSSNPSSVLAAWQGTLQIIENDCETLRPESEDPTLLALKREGQHVVDSINNISRRQVNLLWDGPSGANLKTLVVQGLDLYVFDNENNLVYRMQLSSDGLSIVGLPQPITSMRAGATVDTFTVGNIIDIDFDSQRNRITALDENGVLVSCRPQFINECDAQRVIGSENWVNPIKIDMWQGRMYVLDVGNQQLWRFDPTGDRFPSAGREYFQSSLRPGLTEAVDFDITTDGGVVYILYENGVMSSHLSGQPNDFIFSGFPEGQQLTTVGAQGFHLADNPVSQVFYIVSRSARTVYETTLSGTWMSTFRVQNESLFERLNDVAVADIGSRVVYTASGDSVFAFTKEQ